MSRRLLSHWPKGAHFQKLVLMFLKSLSGPPLVKEKDSACVRVCVCVLGPSNPLLWIELQGWEGQVEGSVSDEGGGQQTGWQHPDCAPGLWGQWPEHLPCGPSRGPQSTATPEPAACASRPPALGAVLPCRLPAPSPASPTSLPTPATEVPGSCLTLLAGGSYLPPPAGTSRVPHGVT